MSNVFTATPITQCNIITLAIDDSCTVCHVLAYYKSMCFWKMTTMMPAVTTMIDAPWSWQHLVERNTALRNAHGNINQTVPTRWSSYRMDGMRGSSSHVICMHSTPPAIVLHRSPTHRCNCSYWVIHVQKTLWVVTRVSNCDKYCRRVTSNNYW